MPDSLDANSFYIEGPDIADAKAPQVPIERRWEERRFGARLVNPANRRKLSVIIVGSGLAGASAAATLGEAGYNVACFCYQDSPRRAHSIAAQGGINAAKNYRNELTSNTTRSGLLRRSISTTLYTSPAQDSV